MHPRYSWLLRLRSSQVCGKHIGPRTDGKALHSHCVRDLASGQQTGRRCHWVVSLQSRRCSDVSLGGTGAVTPCWLGSISAGSEECPHTSWGWPGSPSQLHPTADHAEGVGVGPPLSLSSRLWHTAVECHSSTVRLIRRAAVRDARVKGGRLRLRASSRMTAAGGPSTRPMWLVAPSKFAWCTIFVRHHPGPGRGILLLPCCPKCSVTRRGYSTGSSPQQIPPATP